LIRCIGASCISAPMLIQLSTGPAISHNSDRTDINLLITFRNRIETFKLEDFNFSIRYEDYNIFQTNVR
jgi:hypothetical protein